jgi:hypothetical protein
MASRIIQITNFGTSVLHISSVALSGSNLADFSQTNTCLSVAITVQANCTITANFAPQTQGQRTASLVITDDGAGSPHSVALSGSGAVPFQLSPSGSTSSTVSAGQTGTNSAVRAAGDAGFQRQHFFDLWRRPAGGSLQREPKQCRAVRKRSHAAAGFRLQQRGARLCLRREGIFRNFERGL